jgi:hypothetical protein
VAPTCEIRLLAAADASPTHSERIGGHAKSRSEPGGQSTASIETNAPQVADLSTTPSRVRLLFKN